MLWDLKTSQGKEEIHYNISPRKKNNDFSKWLEMRIFTKKQLSLQVSQFLEIRI